MNPDLKIIKKKYGEDMEKLCRDFFPTILETEGLLPKLFLDHFEPNHSIYKDIMNQGIETEFKNYIYSLIDVEKNNEIKVNKTPKELLSEVGYNLYECQSEEEIQSFKKYYSKGEELCTFNGGRLNLCRVFFAVKKDVEEIKREDYKNPLRQDKYGTSVISIQFTRDSSHTLSIKNRYNHRVNNPDSTYSNNLDNIIMGLTESFEKEYGLIQQHKNNGFEIKGYVRANDGKYYKYNYEINNIYYCENNIIIDNFEVKRYEKEKYIIVDYFIIDLVKKEIKIYDEKIKDTFTETIKDIEKIDIEKEEKEKTIKLKIKNKEEIKIVINEKNQIIKLENNNIEKVGDDFLYWNISLQELILSKLEKAGDYFLHNNEFLQELTLPNLQEVGNYFLSLKNSLQELTLPELEKVGDYFLYWNKSLQKLTLPKLEKVGNYFLRNNESLQELTLPKLEKVGDNFLHSNNTFQEITLPNLKEVGDGFLYYNNSLQELTLPKLEKVGNGFLYFNESLQELTLSNLKEIGNGFLHLHPTFNESNFNNNIRRTK